jgi:hypothetical protein
VGRGEFVHRRAIGVLGWSRSYDLAHVKDLRVTPVVYGSGYRGGRNPFNLTGGPITFDYGAKTIRLGAGVEEAEAKTLVETIKDRGAI